MLSKRLNNVLVCWFGQWTTRHETAGPSCQAPVGNIAYCLSPPNSIAEVVEQCGSPSSRAPPSCLETPSYKMRRAFLLVVALVVAASSKNVTSKPFHGADVRRASHQLFLGGASPPPHSLCMNTGVDALDNYCDSPGSELPMCAYGADCVDCAPRSPPQPPVSSPRRPLASPPATPSPPRAPPATPSPPSLCSAACIRMHAYGSNCDDGGPCNDGGAGSDCHVLWQRTVKAGVARLRRLLEAKRVRP